MDNKLIIHLNGNITEKKYNSYFIFRPDLENFILEKWGGIFDLDPSTIKRTILDDDGGYIRYDFYIPKKRGKELKQIILSFIHDINEKQFSLN